ncbi:MAG: AAA-like domain-containing protein [Prochloraceae cyanobacterium]|nr:AAA-like domain-containing protein [Prochloraceae cyanobacterium]
MKKQRNTRNRGVILTNSGKRKFQIAKSQLELETNEGKRYTLEDLSDLTGLAVDTLMKVTKCEVKVDKQTLKRCFDAFNLSLEPDDYFKPDTELEERSQRAIIPFATDLEWPEGQVPLDSRFYVERSAFDSDENTVSIESICYRNILQPGSLIRIKAPRRMGKTSLMRRILKYGSDRNCRSVFISLTSADSATFRDLDRFLKWFCANISLEMELRNRLEHHWNGLFGSKVSSRIYFEQYLLPQTSEALILGLDEIDSIFLYPHVAEEFFGVLRSWHELAKNKPIWQKLRLVIAHSTEVYIPLSVHSSPFNVGVPIELYEFNQAQILDLATRYELDWSREEVEQLMSLVGGIPYLVRLALYYIKTQNISLETLVSTNLSCDLVYREHLQKQLFNLSKFPQLEAAFSKVIKSSQPLELNLVQNFKLQAMGLVKLQNNLAWPSCQLYRDYFSNCY